jgi:hypothetical protein
MATHFGYCSESSRRQYSVGLLVTVDRMALSKLQNEIILGLDSVY